MYLCFCSYTGRHGVTASGWTSLTSKNPSSVWRRFLKYLPKRSLCIRFQVCTRQLYSTPRMFEIRTVKRESDVVYVLFAIILSDIFRIVCCPAASSQPSLNSLPLSTGLIVYKMMFENIFTITGTRTALSCSRLSSNNNKNSYLYALICTFKLFS